MLLREIAICGLTLASPAWAHTALSAQNADAQTAAVPTAYTVTAKSAMAGPEFPTRTYRLGSKALIDQTIPAQGTTPAMHVRTLYDLDKNSTLTWDTANSAQACAKGTFSGDWGDPFSGLDDLVKQGATQTGTETILGRPARILEASDGGDGKIEAWVDTATRMILKAEMVPANGPPTTMVEVLDVSLAPPPASVFDVPANCASAVAAPQPPTEAEQIAAVTGSDAKDFVNALYAPASKDSCTMVLRVVKAGTLEPIADPFQVAIDLDVASEPAPNYTLGASASGHMTFAGGGLHEITSQIHNGMVRVENVPAQFELEMAFGNAGSSGANLYRQCFAPETVLLYVVKNPAEISDGGDWLWVKSGKYATAP